MKKTNTTNNATEIKANTTTVRTITTMSAETMQSKTIKELVAYINDNFSDKFLARFEMERPTARAKKADLILFIQDIYEALRNRKADNEKKAPVAASAKPAPVKKPVPVKKTAPTPKAEKSESEKETPKAAAPKATPVKKTTPVPEEKAVETKKVQSRKAPETVDKFPKTVERVVDGENRIYTRCDKKYHSIDELRQAFDNGDSILFANFWSPRMLKKYDYAGQFTVNTAPAAFKNNLDLAEMLIVCDKVDKVYALSFDTEAMYAFIGKDLAPVDGVRVINGLEFEIYEYSAQ